MRSQAAYILTSQEKFDLQLAARTLRGPDQFMTGRRQKGLHTRDALLSPLIYFYHMCVFGHGDKGYVIILSQQLYCSPL